MFIKKLIIGLLSFWAFEIKSSSSANKNSPIEIVYELILEESKRQEKKKKQERLYPKGKRRKNPSYKVKSFAYKQSKPRDHRFSNQKMLRRMYRNF